jgi:hypothetical protein
MDAEPVTPDAFLDLPTPGLPPELQTFRVPPAGLAPHRLRPNTHIDIQLLVAPRVGRTPGRYVVHRASLFRYRPL